MPPNHTPLVFNSLKPHTKHQRRGLCAAQIVDKKSVATARCTRTCTSQGCPDSSASFGRCAMVAPTPPLALDRLQQSGASPDWAQSPRGDPKLVPVDMLMKARPRRGDAPRAPLDDARPLAVPGPRPERRGHRGGRARRRRQEVKSVAFGPIDRAPSLGPAGEADAAAGSSGPAPKHTSTAAGSSGPAPRSRRSSSAAGSSRWSRRTSSSTTTCRRCRSASSSRPTRRATTTTSKLSYKLATSASWGGT